MAVIAILNPRYAPSAERSLSPDRPPNSIGELRLEALE
jgi:hypothetical protein